LNLLCSTAEHILTHPLTDEVRYRLLRYLSDHPEATQRELARELGISLGKANYCIQALIAKGLVKARNFRNSSRKRAYAYALTPSGLQEKLDLTYAFLRWKVREYDLLREEIERISEEIREVEAGQPASTG
jgi:EPS-associated MarR family transcriptional regulator